jgi:transcriptional regulator with XRE-family HTH domain
MPALRDGKHLRGRSKASEPTSIDRHVGARMRSRRSFLGMSQERLGGAIGLTFQQIQKYERGANRISAGRLFEIARVLEVPVGFFFEEMPTDAGGDGFQAGLGRLGVGRLGPENAPEGVDEPQLDAAVQRETLELARAYRRIPDPRLRRKLLDLASALSLTATAL